MSPFLAELLFAPDPLHAAVMRDVRHMEAVGHRAQQDALIAGAMPSDFQVVLRFKARREGFGYQIVPELV